MTDDPHIALLAAITWLTDRDPAPAPALADWLLEKESMTRRFERHCRHVTIRRGREGYYPAPALGDDIALLPPSDRYWLREIVLCGDDIPWLAGRTLMPENAMNGSEWALTTLGDVPLGRWLFRNRTPERDFIQLGRKDGLWARRSCLRPDGKPLLLTELFLPAAPLYC